MKTANPLTDKAKIVEALKAFDSGSLVSNAIHLFDTLGYRSSKTLQLEPNTNAGLLELANRTDFLNPAKAHADEWQSVDFLFQLTDEEIRNLTLGGLDFDSKADVQSNKLIESYIFFAVQLRGDSYPRTALADVTREINRLFPMPALVLFKHGKALTLSIINRRIHKRDAARDVLEKVTLIKDIRIEEPHRGQVEILFDLAFPQLIAKYEITNFVQLEEAWRKTLDTSELNKRFYKDLANWYFWALQHVEFPKQEDVADDVNRATNVIRLITRLIFVWFLKERELVPDALFDPKELSEVLKDLSDDKSTFYKAILQNLFFATLNTPMNDKKAPRAFRQETNGKRFNDQYMVHNQYRHEKLFKDSKRALEMFAGIPFLNGGLFECLDKREEANGKLIETRIDGFSDMLKKQPTVPNKLFFASEEQIDLNEVYGTNNKPYSVRGLINTLDRYKFTIAENTPIEEEVALDPELLGKVFENLLASYNPETGATARKQTGSFYTPREIVNYMVDESLIAYLENQLVVGSNGQSSSELNLRVRQLFAYTDEQHQFSDEELDTLIAAIDRAKILDPACGSGAFPMGILQKLVFILSKLDPKNAKWEQRQIERVREAMRAAERIEDHKFRENTLQDLQAQIANIEEAFASNELDYGRKLFLIENCIYGVDIQPIAIQIAKLRFFISLVIDQTIRAQAENLGVRPLPNLETKFIAANALVSLEKPERVFLRNTAIDEKERELKIVRERYFTARTTRTKDKYRGEDERLRREIGALLEHEGNFPHATTERLIAWNPYDHNATADFFDPEWMFGVQEGFDVVIGNPPYLNVELVAPKQKEYFAKMYKTFYKRYDVFGLFFEQSLTSFVKSGGVTLIVPSQVFNNLSYKKLREMILSKRWLREVFYLGDKVFLSANNDVCVLFLQKPNVNRIRLVNALDFENRTSTEVDTDFFDKFGGVISMSSESTGSVTDKIFNPNYPKLRADFDVFQGIATGNNAAYLLSDEQIRDARIEKKVLHSLLMGRDFEKWRIRNAERQIIYLDRDTDIKKYPNTEKWLLPFKSELKQRRECRRGVIPWYALQWARDKSQLDYTPKILLQRTRNPRLKTRIVAAIDDEGFYGMESIIFIVPKTQSVSVHYLLAVLNSTLINYLYQTKFLNVAVKAEYLKDTPIPSGTSEQQSSAVRLVNQILAAKRKSPNADTLKLEVEIDQLVYDLYKLTPNERAIVEASARK